MNIENWIPLALVVHEVHEHTRTQITRFSSSRISLADFTFDSLWSFSTQTHINEVALHTMASMSFHVRAHWPPLSWCRAAECCRAQGSYDLFTETARVIFQVKIFHQRIRYSWSMALTPLYHHSFSVRRTFEQILKSTKNVLFTARYFHSIRSRQVCRPKKKGKKKKKALQEWNKVFVTEYLPVSAFSPCLIHKSLKIHKRAAAFACVCVPRAVHSILCAVQSQEVVLVTWWHRKYKSISMAHDYSAFSFVL